MSPALEAALAELQRARRAREEARAAYQAAEAAIRSTSDAHALACVDVVNAQAALNRVIDSEAADATVDASK